MFVDTPRYVSRHAFQDVALRQPPYPSVANYDAKLWEFVEQHAEDGDYVWNVGSDRGKDLPPQ